MTRRHLYRFSLFSAFMVLLGFFFCMTPCSGESLIIIVPYKAAGTAIQRDTAWNTVAEQFRDYKEAGGLDTQVFTLDFINTAYDDEGVDEPERIKRLIYNRVRYGDARYVMIVGDTGIFPIRYQYFGYSSDNLTHWAWDDDNGLWYAHESYGFFPCDAYYSNLWDNDDPTRTFDTWDGDGDGLYGEKYYDNFRGADGNTIHPDVALGRVPCKNPDEFYRYMVKVMKYETYVCRMGVDKKALFIGGGFHNSQATKRSITDFLDDLYEIALLLGEDGEPWSMRDEGSTDFDVDPRSTFIDYVNLNQPQFINYAGHGAPWGLAEADFQRSDVSALTNTSQPAIVIAPGSCSTACFAQSDNYSAPPGITTALGLDNDSMAEAFLTDYSDGGVIYVGSLVSNQPPGHYFDSRFFRAVDSGVSRVGDCFLAAMEDYIDEYRLDTANRSTWEEVASWPEPAVGGRWDWFPPARFHSVYKVALFGDPSLRINGIPGLSSPPFTTIDYRRWLNRQDFYDHLRGYLYMDVTFFAHDPETPVLSTHHAYMLDGELSQWREGSSFTLPIDMTSTSEGDEGYRIVYYSINAVGDCESTKRADISFDFNCPQSEITATYGEDDPLVVDGVLVFDTDSLTISATDNISGVARIDYRYGAESDFHSAPGPNLTLGFPCYFNTSHTLSYRAVDAAGNEEPWNTQTVRMASCSDYLEIRERFADLLEAQEARHMFNQPPGAVDGILNLGMRTLGYGNPDKVVFQYSGPFSGDYKGHLWQNISEAAFNIKTQRWEATWDTVAAGIGNGFYWVRSMPEYFGKKGVADGDKRLDDPHLLWINNLARDNPEKAHLLIEGKQVSVRPGDTLTVSVSHNIGDKSELVNASIRLMLDEALFLDLKEEEVLKTVPNWKAGSPVDFTLTLKDENLPDIGQLAFKAAVQANGVPLLTSSYLSVVLEKRPVSVSGTVRNVKGQPMAATLALSIPPLKPVTTQTDKSGNYAFTGVPPDQEVYLLSVMDLDGDNRVVLPRGGDCLVRSDGEDVIRDFLLAGDDVQPPVFTNLDSFEQVEDLGVLTGLVCDGDFGSGVVAVTLFVKDESRDLYLDTNGNWQSSETGIPVLDIDESQCPRPVSDIGFTPVQNTLPPDTRCVSFSHSLPLAADLGFGRKSLTVEAEDSFGNVVSHVLRRSVVRAAFGAGITMGTAPCTVTFDNMSTGAADFFTWNFGDGTTSTGVSPSHTFEKPGVYTVSLQAGAMESNDYTEKTAFITVTEGASGGGGGGCFLLSVM